MARPRRWNGTRWVEYEAGARVPDEGPLLDFEAGHRLLVDDPDAPTEDREAAARWFTDNPLPVPPGATVKRFSVRVPAEPARQAVPSRVQDPTLYVIRDLDKGEP